MTSQPNETLIPFPSEFPIKAFGAADERFERLVLEIVQRHAPDTTVDQVTRRKSQGGKYDAVTVTIMATSKSQLDAIYHDLTASPDVIMAL
jgi:putative lipoic acid-binding regulatory protein